MTNATVESATKLTDEFDKWQAELTSLLSDLAHKDGADGARAEGLGQFLPTLRAAIAALQAEPQFVPWVNVRGCGWHHYTPQNIDAMIRDLKAVEQGNEIPEWVNRDHRTRCGILWRVITALSHDVPLNPDPVTADDGFAQAPVVQATPQNAASDEALLEVVRNYGEARVNRNHAQARELYIDIKRERMNRAAS